MVFEEEIHHMNGLLIFFPVSLEPTFYELKIGFETDDNKLRAFILRYNQHGVFHFLQKIVVIIFDDGSSVS